MYKKGVKRSQILNYVSNVPKEKPNIRATGWAMNIGIDYVTKEIYCAFTAWVNYTDIYGCRQYDCPIELYNWVLIEGNK